MLMVTFVVILQKKKYMQKFLKKSNQDIYLYYTVNGKWIILVFIKEILKNLFSKIF